jgi:hypothetical protein
MSGKTALRLECALIALAALVLCCAASHSANAGPWWVPRSTFYNNYVRLADSILHGHLDIDWPGRTIDAAEYHGKHYGVDGPFPVVFVLPLVWIYQLVPHWSWTPQHPGYDANQTWVAIAGAVAVMVLAWRLLLRFGLQRAERLWLMLFLFAGTDLWWCAELGDVWFLAHIVAFALTLLALLELTGKRRGWLVALYAAGATESRFTLVLALPLYAYALANPQIFGDLAESAPERYEPRRALRNFGAVIAAGVAGWVALNEAMWGTVVDIGHTLYFHQDPWGQPTGSPFRLTYLPYQIYSFFMRPPELVEWLQQVQAPYFKVNANGIALTFTSPALVLAFLARKPRPLVIALWVTVALVAGPSFLYYLNGWYQFGMRHALDFEPFLLVLMAIAVRAGMPLWGKVLCAYSALVGLWGVWFWNVYFRNGV